MDLIQQIIKKEPDSLVINKDAFGAWSISKLKLLEKCPLSFYLRYVLKIKREGLPPSLITNVGKAAHRIIELLIMGKSITDCFKIAQKEYSPLITKEEWDANVATLEYNISEFRQRLDTFEKANPIKRYIQELQIGLTSQFEPTGFFADDVYFRGVIDLGLQTESNDVIIIDHKTGAPSKMGIRNFKTQLDTYKVVYHYGVGKVEGAQSGIHFVKDGQVILDDYVHQRRQSKVIYGTSLSFIFKAQLIDLRK
jgi:RecB family exonuclease